MIFSFPCYFLLAFSSFKLRTEIKTKSNLETKHLISKLQHQKYNLEQKHLEKFNKKVETPILFYITRLFLLLLFNFSPVRATK